MSVWLEILFVAFFISLPFLYDSFRTFRYYFRLATFTILAAFTSLLAIFQFKHRSRLIAYFGQQISDLLSLEWNLQGKKNLSSKRTRVAIMNYQTDIDTLGLLHLIYCQENELNIISETNYINLLPFSFFPWLLSLTLCPIQFFSTSLGILYFSPTITDSWPTVVLPSKIMTTEETIKMAFKKKLPVQPIVFSNRYFLNKEKHLFEPASTYLNLVNSPGDESKSNSSYVLSPQNASQIKRRVIISVMPIIETDDLLSNDITKFSNEISTKIRAEYDCISKVTELSDYQTPC